MHSPGQLSIFRDGADIVRRLRFPPECMAPEDSHPTAAINYWRELDRGGLLPSRKSIDPVKMRGLIGSMHILDTTDTNPGNYYFRLWGSNISLDS